MKAWRIIFALWCCFIAFPAQAQFQLQIETDLESQQFLRHRERHDINQYLDFSALVRAIYDNKKNLRLEVDPWIKLDVLSGTVYRYIPNDAYLDFYGEHFELKAGLMLWPLGAAESFNPTDILNRNDLENDYYEPEKLGELIVAGTVSGERLGFLREPALTLMVLPLFQETPLPDNESRFALAGSQNGLRYSLIEPQERPGAADSWAGALLLSAHAGAADVQLIYYHGPEHDPGYRLVIDDQGALRLQPFTYGIDMVGLNGRIPVSRFVFKVEAAYKYTGANDFVGHEIQPVDENAIPESYVQFVLGGDYTFSNVFKKGEIRVFTEFLGEDDATDSYRSFRPFKRDIAIGFNWTFNDARLTSLSAAVIKDLATRETIVKGEFSTVLYKTLRAHVATLYVWPADAPSALAFFDNNSSVSAGISYAWGKKW